MDLLSFYFYSLRQSSAPGFRGTIGEVVEDRGPIGIRGRRLYGIKLRLDPWNEHTTELPEESLEAVAGGPKPARNREENG